MLLTQYLVPFAWPLGIVAIVGSLASSIRWHKETATTKRAGSCVECKYSMDGLAEDARCPECGCLEPRIQTVKPGTIGQLKQDKSTGIAIVGLITFASMIFHPPLWELIHGLLHGCPVRFGDLDGDSLAGTVIGSDFAMLFYFIYILTINKTRWQRASVIIALASVVGSLVGFMIAIFDARLWHGYITDEIALSSVATTIIAAVFLLRWRGPRRKQPNSNPSVN
jgi:hypothetical protein